VNDSLIDCTSSRSGGSDFDAHASGGFGFGFDAPVDDCLFDYPSSWHGGYGSNS
jgi:hypothetical protein